MSARAGRSAAIKARLLTALGATAVVTLLVLSGLTGRADAWIGDRLLRQVAGPADDRILVVAVDEPSLAKLGRWPWSRRVHAQLIDRLSAARVRGVALDILLSEPALYDPEGDALLAQALNRSGRVVLPVYSEPQQSGGASVELIPIPEFAASAAALGHVDMPVEADGVARSAFLRAGLGTPHWSSLALALAQLGDEPQASANLPGLRNPQETPATSQTWVRDHQVLVPYVRGRQGFQQVSFADVVEGKVPASQLRGRWVIVGVTAAGMGNEPALPPGQHGPPPRSALDYQANVLNMLVNGKAITPLPIAAQVALSALLAVLPLLLYGQPGMRPIWKPILVALIAVPIVSWLLLRFGQLWFAPAAAMLVLGLGAAMRVARSLHRRHRQAESDPLTGLANRLRFDQALDHELRQTRRSSQPLSLLLLDVDYFKRLNDHHGQQTGDDVLRALAAVLRARARRPRDLVARLGGDQFALMLPETTPQAAAAIATTVHVDLANLAAHGNGTAAALPPFTISVGIHTTRKGEEANAEKAYERADTALYQAKQAGRNRSTLDQTDAPPSR